MQLSQASLRVTTTSEQKSPMPGFKLSSPVIPSGSPGPSSVVMISEETLGDSAMRSPGAARVTHRAAWRDCAEQEAALAACCSITIDNDHPNQVTATPLVTNSMLSASSQHVQPWPRVHLGNSMNLYRALAPTSTSCKSSYYLASELQNHTAPGYMPAPQSATGPLSNIQAPHQTTLSTHDTSIDHELPQTSMHHSGMVQGPHHRKQPPTPQPALLYGLPGARPSRTASKRDPVTGRLLPSVTKCSSSQLGPGASTLKHVATHVTTKTPTPCEELELSHDDMENAREADEKVLRSKELSTLLSDMLGTDSLAATTTLPCAARLRDTCTVPVDITAIRTLCIPRPIKVRDPPSSDARSKPAPETAPSKRSISPSGGGEAATTAGQDTAVDAKRRSSAWGKPAVGDASKVHQKLLVVRPSGKFWKTSNVPRWHANGHMLCPSGHNSNWDTMAFLRRGRIRPAADSDDDVDHEDSNARWLHQI